MNIGNQPNSLSDIYKLYIFYFHMDTSFNHDNIIQTMQMEQHTLKNVNNYRNTSIYSYLETSGGQS
jgi:hypothetical protein